MGCGIFILLMINGKALRANGEKTMVSKRLPVWKIVDNKMEKRARGNIQRAHIKAEVHRRMEEDICALRMRLYGTTEAPWEYITDFLGRRVKRTMTRVEMLADMEQYMKLTRATYGWPMCPSGTRTFLDWFRDSGIKRTG